MLDRTWILQKWGKIQSTRQACTQWNVRITKKQLRYRKAFLKTYSSIWSCKVLKQKIQSKGDKKWYDIVPVWKRKCNRPCKKDRKTITRKWKQLKSWSEKFNFEKNKRKLSKSEKSKNWSEKLLKRWRVGDMQAQNNKSYSPCCLHNLIHKKRLSRQS